MHMYFAMFSSIIALPFYIFSDTIFDRMVTTFRFPVWHLLWFNFGFLFYLIWEELKDAFDSIRVFHI